MKDLNESNFLYSDTSDPETDVQNVELKSSQVSESKNSNSVNVPIASDNDSDSDKERNCNANSTNNVDQDSNDELNFSDMTQIYKVASSQENNNSENPVKSTFSFEDLASDDEIYTIQYPATLSKDDLEHKTLGSVNYSKSADKTSGLQFQFVNSEKKFITLAIPKKSSSTGTLLSLPLKGHIVIEKVLNLPTDDVMHEDVCDKSNVSFPNDIITRHPLLGLNWEDQIRAAHNAIKRAFHKKKKKKEKFKTEEVMEVPRKVKRERSDSETSPVKRKKKRHEKH